MTRLREKLPGLGSCDGAAEERKNCDNEVCEKGLNYPLISSKEKKIERIRLLRLEEVTNE